MYQEDLDAFLKATFKELRANYLLRVLYLNEDINAREHCNRRLAMDLPGRSPQLPPPEVPWVHRPADQVGEEYESYRVNYKSTFDVGNNTYTKGGKNVRNSSSIHGRIDMVEFRGRIDEWYGRQRLEVDRVAAIITKARKDLDKVSWADLSYVRKDVDSTIFIFPKREGLAFVSKERDGVPSITSRLWETRDVGMKGWRLTHDKPIPSQEEFIRQWLKKWGPQA